MANLVFSFLLFLILSPASALAQEMPEAAMTMPSWPFYLFAVIVGVVVSQVLSHMARANAKVDLCAAPKKTDDKNFTRFVEDELGETIKEQETRVQIVQTISDKMNRRLSEVAGELKNKYESVIAEKDRQQEIVHLKYKNVVAEKNQTEAVVKSLAEGLVVVNSRGEVVMMNPAAEKLLGVNKGAKLGRPLTENLRGEEMVSLVNETAQAGEKVVELKSSQEETKKIIRASSALIESENGQTVGMVSVLTDVTKQKELDRLKSQFVSTVTHELRTPLVATQKALAVIIDKSAGVVSADQARFLDIADRNLNRLSRLINDILDFSKLEAGKMKLEPVLSRMEGVIEEVCTSLGTWANSKEIRLEKKLGENLPELPLDSNRLIQVFNNLIGNALKFTPKGGCVSVEAKLRNSGSEVEVSVQDTGAGIPKKDLERVFERFLQLGERRQTDISGTGLGLSIAKEIVELHGGRIWAESEEGQGAKFIFVLPVKG